MKTYLMLGRLGDIANVLPALWEEHRKTGDKQRLIVAREYAHLLDGCSYVEPLVWEGAWDRPIEAKAWALQQHRSIDIIDCSVHGANVRVSRDMSSFNREIWRLTRNEVPFEETELMFDRRDPEREKLLVSAVIDPVDARPNILFAGAGHSSPFPEADQFLKALRAAMPEHNVVDISAIRSARPYDLLALYDMANGLVATDSFPLHLAVAAQLPVAALHPVGPTAWHRSAWRPNHVFNCLYSEAIDRVPDIARALVSPFRRLVYVTSQTPNADPATRARVERAKKARRDEHIVSGRWWEEIDFQPGERSGAQLKDKALPFVRDMVDHAAKHLLSPDDVIVLGNADIAFVSGLTGKILSTIDRFGCAFSHRWDFNPEQLRRRLPVTENHLAQGKWYPGSDLFAFTKGWWLEHHEGFPDMLLGREAWDMVMRNLIKKTGHRIDTELHRAVWHEKHLSPWEQSPRLPGNEHNRRLAQLWLARHGGDWNDWRNLPHYRT